MIETILQVLLKSLSRGDDALCAACEQKTQSRACESTLEAAGNYQKLPKQSIQAREMLGVLAAPRPLFIVFGCCVVSSGWPSKSLSIVF